MATKSGVLYRTLHIPVPLLANATCDCLVEGVAYPLWVKCLGFGCQPLLTVSHCCTHSYFSFHSQKLGSSFIISSISVKPAWLRVLSVIKTSWPPGVNMQCQRKAAWGTLFSFNLRKQWLLLANTAIMSLMFSWWAKAACAAYVDLAFSFLWQLAHWPHRLESLFL